MKQIRITENCIIYNDFLVTDDFKIYRSLLYRWISMWKRCKDSNSKSYKTYKDCEIDERYKYFSNYINDIKQLENFDKLYNEPSKWVIDKDIKDPNNRHYYLENLSIISKEENSREQLKRNGSAFNIIKNNSTPPQPIIAININDSSILIFKSMSEAEDMGFDHGNISKCCRKKYNKHSNIYKKYKWYYLDYNHGRKLRYVH